MQQTRAACTPATRAINALPRINIVVRDLGRMAYGDALSIQRELHAKVVAERTAEDDSADTGGATRPRGSPRSMCLLLVEHDPPVITVSARRTARANLIASPEQLDRVGVEVCETDRGGDITYHGPGQLVVYPILDLNALGLRLHGYMRFLEQVVIDTLSQWGIQGHRDPAATGVWVGSPASQVAPSAKICALGVRVSRWVSMHGLALNVTTNLDHFNLIIPCGLAGRTVTSVQRLLGPACPAMDEVKRTFADAFREAIAAQASAPIQVHRT